MKLNDLLNQTEVPGWIDKEAIRRNIIHLICSKLSNDNYMVYERMFDMFVDSKASIDSIEWNGKCQVSWIDSEDNKQIRELDLSK